MSIPKIAILRLLRKHRRRTGHNISDIVLTTQAAFLAEYFGRAEEVRQKLSNIELCRATVVQQLNKLDAEVEALQSTCPHLDVTGKTCGTCNAEVVE